MTTIGTASVKIVATLSERFELALASGNVGPETADPRRTPESYYPTLTTTRESTTHQRITFAAGTAITDDMTNAPDHTPTGFHGSTEPN